MRRFRIVPVPILDRWRVEGWVEADKGLFGRGRPGYWTIVDNYGTTRDEARALAEHLAQPPEEIAW